MSFPAQTICHSVYKNKIAHKTHYPICGHIKKIGVMDIW